MSYTACEECLEFAHCLSSEKVQSTLQTWHHYSPEETVDPTLGRIIPLQQFGGAHAQISTFSELKRVSPDCVSYKSHRERWESTLKVARCLHLSEASWWSLCHRLQKGTLNIFMVSPPFLPNGHIELASIWHFFFFLRKKKSQKKSKMIEQNKR